MLPGRARTWAANHGEGGDDADRTAARRSGSDIATVDATPGRSVRDVFVVHGRDQQLRERFYEFLRAVDLRPLEWETIVAATGRTTPSLLTVIHTALTRAQAIVVLLSPDDTVQLHPSLRKHRESGTELVPMMQPRPNVLVELGMALIGCPDRTIVVEIGELRPIADLGGLNVIRLDGGEAALGKLVQRLKSAGCRVDDTGADWRAAGRFAQMAAHNRLSGRSRWRNRTEPGQPLRTRLWPR
jgi:predicted nucleotide-binding protein